MQVSDIHIYIRVYIYINIGNTLGNSKKANKMSLSLYK